MLKPINPQLLFSRNDPQDPRLGDLSALLSLDQLGQSSFEFALVGYPDDEGIKLNGGRLGSALAPDQIRQFLYRLTPQVFSQRTYGIADLGNIDLTNLDLARRHQLGATIGEQIYKLKKKTLLLGGGHDYAYADGAAFIKSFSGLSEKPIILNFDAHLDVRNLDHGLTSGTSFYRLLSEFPKQFDLVEVGIQPQCNSRHHLRWLEDHGGAVISYEEIDSKGLSSALNPWFENNSRPCFLSVDIDGFQAAEAPGCSQSWTTGIQAAQFIDTLRKMSQHFSLKGLGIYEVSPPLDIDQRTSKLAALLIHHFIHLA